MFLLTWFRHPRVTYQRNALPRNRTAPEAEMPEAPPEAEAPAPEPDPMAEWAERFVPKVRAVGSPGYCYGSLPGLPRGSAPDRLRALNLAWAALGLPDGPQDAEQLVKEFVE